MGSAARLALAQALVLVQVLAPALPAGCLRSEEERWSGDAGFSRGRRRRQEFCSTPNGLLPISNQPWTRQQWTNQCDLRIHDPHDHLGLQQGISQLGVLQQHVPGFLGAVLDTQLRRHTRSELQQGTRAAAMTEAVLIGCSLPLTFICFMSSNICSGGRLATARLMDSGASSGLTGSP